MGFGFSSSGGGKRITVDVVNQVDKGNWSAQGVYSSNTRYRHLVTYSDGNRYTALSDNTNQTPSASSSYWAIALAKGDTGSTGAAGATWYSGFDTPAGAGVTGADGDFFFDTSSEAKIYKRTSGTWSQVNAIRGPTGAAGSNGTNGTNGADGAGITAGTNGTYGLGMQCNSAAFTGYSSTGMYVFCNSSNQLAYRINGGAEQTPYSVGGALGAPSSATLTNATGLPISGLVASTSTALGVGSIELGAASDTTIARSAAGVATIEGVVLTRTIASGTSALGTGAISSGACASAVTTTATGTATTDVVNWGFNGTPVGATGYAASENGMLTIIAYPSANNVNFLVCNNTAASITPGAITLNWSISR